MPSLSAIKPKPLRWLWSHHIALGKVTLLLGPTGAGKSLLTLDMAARVSAGKPWPNSPEEQTEPGGVLLLTGEEDLEDTVVPRLAAAGADLDRIHTMPVEEEQPLTLPENMAAIEKAIHSTPGCRLVIVDPLSDYLPQTSPRKQPPLKSILKPLNDLAARTSTAIVVILPIPASTSRATTNRTLGNLTAQAAPYSVWQLATEADAETGIHHWLLPLRNNHAPPNTALAFQPQATENETAHITPTYLECPAPPCLGRPARESASPRNQPSRPGQPQSANHTPPCLGRLARESASPRQQPSRPSQPQPANLARQAELPSPHSNFFEDDPDPYEGIPSLEGYLDNFPEPPPSQPDA